MKIIHWFLSPFRIRKREVRLWRYQCDTPGDLRKTIDAYFTSLDTAVDWLEKNDCFKVTEIDRDESLIHYVVDWTLLREKVPSKWCAMHCGDRQGGTFYTPKLIRSEAIKFVVGSGSHVIRGTDDEHCIISYQFRS